jgi:hypothetical protein
MALRQDRRRADTQLKEEVKRNKDQLEEERRLAGEREQFAEASSVEVVLAVPQGSIGFDKRTEAAAPQLKLTVKNHGSGAITGIRAFAVDSTGVFEFTDPRQAQRWDALNPNSQYVEPVPGAHPDWLPPWSAQLIFENDLPDSMKDKKEDLAVYPVVRWTDRWGTNWEHRRGKLVQPGSSDRVRFTFGKSGPGESPWIFEL